MVRWLITAVLFLLLLAVQAAARPYIALFDATPDLLIILVVQFALIAPQLDGVIASWLMGFVTDLHGGNPAGLIALTWALIALLIYHIRRQLFAGHLLTRLLLVALAEVFQSVTLMFSQILRGQPTSFLLFWRQAILGIAYTVTVAIAVLPLLSAVLHHVYAKPREG